MSTKHTPGPWRYDPISEGTFNLKVRMKNALADECPACDSDDLCIDNVDGMECMQCGCWFCVDDEGNIEWAYKSRPQECE